MSTSWDMISRGEKRLYKGMTLAVIYVVHLRHFLNLSLSRFQYPQEWKDAKMRRYILRRFGVWAKCNCGDAFCPCLWNFANKSGLCRNQVDTCKVQQSIPTIISRLGGETMELSASYGLTKFSELRETWAMMEGDPSEQEATSTSRVIAMIVGSQQ